MYPGTMAHKSPSRMLVLSALTATMSWQTRMIRKPNRIIFEFISFKGLASSSPPAAVFRRGNGNFRRAMIDYTERKNKYPATLGI
jgi:hypothetical protein